MSNNDKELDKQMQQCSKSILNNWWHLCSMDPDVIRRAAAGDPDLTSLLDIGTTIQTSFKAAERRGPLDQESRAALDSTELIMGILEAELLSR